MKTYKLFLWLCCILISILQATGQTYQPDGSAKVGNTESAFEFNNALFRYTDILSINADMSGGIIGTIDASGGYIILEVYSSDKKQLIYKKRLNTSSTSFAGNTENTTWLGKPIATDQIKTLSSLMSFSTKQGNPPPEIKDPSFFKASMYAYLSNYYFENPYAKSLKDNNFNNEQNVYVKVTAKSATVKRIRFPGQVHELVMGDLNPDKPFSVTIIINGIDNGTVTSKSIPIFNAKVGDDIKFVFNNIYPQFNRKPIFKGIPAVWKAHFAGETKYYCTPSIQPNDIKAWLGFDSQVHGTLQRRYPPGYKERYSNFTTDNSGNILSWSFTLQREMDPNKTSYTPTYEWPKQKTVPVTQRNSQKEGLNMEFLKMNNNRSYISYTGLPYLLGSDPDEIYYLNGQQYDTKKYIPVEGLLIKKDEVWKRVPFEESKDPVNDMVNAYLKNRYALYGEKRSDIQYDAYEIQDNGTSPTNPDGTGSGNNKAPGLCSITLGGTKVSFKLNVTSPFGNQNGFYANIVGSRWPGWDEKEYYAIMGLSSFSVPGLKSLALAYANENSIGNVNTQVFKFSSLSDAKLAEIIAKGFFNTDFLITDFQLKGNGYNNITIYKYNQAQTDSTILAGKELLTIVLRFITVPKNDRAGDVQLNEISDGGYIYLEDFRDNRAGDPLYIPLYGRYSKKFTRDYVLPKGSSITFYTLDSDPFTFYNTATEWYLSSRYQAKRLPLEGTESQKTNIKYYLDPLNEDGSVKSLSANFETGSTFTHKYDQEGDFQLRVEYRNSNIKCYHRIKVVNYPDQTKGKILVREITDKERKLLNFYENSYVIAEVKDVFAKYMYVDGYRSQSPINRFGKYNDYYAHYKWTDPIKGSEIYNPSSVRETLRNYVEIAWLPYNWVRHFSDKPYPIDINPNLFTTPENHATYIKTLYAKAPEPWQVRLPWAPITASDGARYRTNIKVIYDMNIFFDNTVGAFSGNPKAISSKEVFNNFISDDQQDKKELYQDLMHGRKIIVYRNTASLRVENVSTKSEEKSVFIAGYVKPNSLARSAMVTTVTTQPITSMLNATVATYDPIEQNGFLYRPENTTAWKSIKGTLFNNTLMGDYINNLVLNTMYEIKPYVATKNDTTYGYFTKLIAMPSDSVITYRNNAIVLQTHPLINGEYLSFQWYKNGVPIDKATLVECSFAGNKSSDRYSCIATTENGITVYVPSFSIPNEYFSPNIYIQKATIYPNPVMRGGIINLKIDNPTAVTQMNICNAIGNVVQTIRGYNSFVNINSLMTGAYVLQIVYENNEIVRLNFIVY